MPHRNHIPSYCHHRASGQAYVHLNGRDQYLGPYDSPESKARYQEIVRRHLADRAEKELKADLERGVRLHTGLTVAEVAERYLVHAQKKYVKNGRETNQVRIISLSLRVILDRFAHLEADLFGPKALKECQEAFVAQGLSRTEANRRTRLVRKFFGWAVAEELIPPGNWDALKAVEGLRKGQTAAPDRKKIGPVADEAVEAVIPHLAAPVAAMVRLQALTGMRPGEVVTMRAGDLITTGPIWEYRPQSSKLDHLDIECVVMIGPRAQEVLKPWLKVAPEAFLFSPRESMAGHRAERRKARKTPLWASHEAAQERKRKARPVRAPRDRYDVASYRRAIHRACDLAFPHPELSRIPEQDLTAPQRTALEVWRKARRWSPNRLRHAAATRLRREMGIEAARTVLGHSDADTSAIYAERDLELAREAVRRLG
jgi:integrase